jgi:SAM-dependent methyltransferase
MNSVCSENEIPLTGARWAAKAEAYGSLIAEHLSPDTVWLDAGCGSRLLEADMDLLENWLVGHCKKIVGMDVSVSSHRNIKELVEGSLYKLPFEDASFDLITCNMVIEHLENPENAFSEVARCLRPNGAFVANTPNLMNYGVLANAVATRIMPEKLRLRMVHGSDGRAPDDIFPVQYKANTMRRLVQLLRASGLQIHKAIHLEQQRPFFRKTGPLEKLFMKATPFSGLLVCAHRQSA